ncbi:MAG TPA: hypothetical protein VMT53_15920 [Terriglobales bacterium]|nr:hypothetical protein [Terriglobales bacterium]
MSCRRTGPAALAPPPGEILRGELLQPLKMSAYAISEALLCPAIESTTLCWRSVALLPTQPSAWVIFRHDPEFWMNL